MSPKAKSEFELIESLTPLLQKRAGVLHSIGDDCAHLFSLQAPTISVDALVENVHFRLDWLEKYGATETLGWKTLAVSVSDLAASGAFPVAAFVALGVPSGGQTSWVRAVYQGMESCARQFGFSVAGGDMTSSPVWSFTATLVGELMPQARAQPVLRNGARVGDWVCVTRDLGASGAALELLQRGLPLPDELQSAHFSPFPETETMRALLQKGRDNIHAALDLSDGLGSDAFHIATQSGVQIEIECERLPIAARTHEVARALGLNPFDLALGGGEDYALLVCCQTLVPDLIPIGRVVKGQGVRFLEAGKTRVARSGWRHF